MILIKVTRKGQVTIPKVFREKLNIFEEDYLAVELREDKIIFWRPKLPEPGEPVGLEEYNKILKDVEEARKNWR